MQLDKRNFGISGQDHEYDSFLCFTARCRRRKQERHKAKMAKRESKTDQRRAETEQMRAETLMMKAMAMKKNQPQQMPVSNATPTPTIIQQMPQAPAAKPQVAQAGFGGNKMMMVVGLLLVGGFIYNNMKNKKAGAGLGLAPTPQPAIA